MKPFDTNIGIEIFRMSQCAANMATRIILTFTVKQS